MAILIQKKAMLARAAFAVHGQTVAGLFGLYKPNAINCANAGKLLICAKMRNKMKKRKALIQKYSSCAFMFIQTV
jgi:hypothetical protein